MMRDVFIVGIGQTPVGEHWHLGLRDLAALALRSAFGDAGIESVGALCVGNMLGGCLNGQENVATAVADALGLHHPATLAVASGAYDVAAAVGVEKMTDGLAETVTAGLATASDQDYEASHGFSFPALAALLMKRYMHETGKPREAFAPFAVEAHRNASTNANAMFRDPITPQQFARSPVVASPIGLLDAAPICDGAAAVILCSKNALRPGQRGVRIAGSAVATDTIGLASREDILTLGGAAVSARRAYEAARCGPDDLHLFEAHDAFTIITTLSVEACGLAKRGQALDLAAEGVFSRGGRWPLSTFGGLKARGHPVGASGAYQIAEAVLQLRGEAGENQVPGARRALTQSIGGHGSVVVTHVLEA
jgi:acetyl-CoA C-acetyltransferase